MRKMTLGFITSTGLFFVYKRRTAFFRREFLFEMF